MRKCIAIVATMDTKGDQIAYLKEQIEEKGISTCTIDIGVAADGPFRTDYDRHKVASAGGTSIADILSMNNRRAGLEKMGEGAASIVRDLNVRGELVGVVSAGGSQGTAIALLLMQTVPLGIPKLLLTTIAYSPVIVPDMVGGSDLIMMPWVAGLWGLNPLSKQCLDTAACAIAAAAENYRGRPLDKSRKIVGISSLGGSVQRYADTLKPALEARGHEVGVFHALGMPGRIFERAISDGLISASLDLSVGSELINQLKGGVYAGGEHRLEAAGRMGIPQIVSPGGIEVFMWGKDRPLPSRYKDRPMVAWHSSLHVSISTTPEEMAAVGKLMAHKVNIARGPVTVILPLQGIGWAPGTPFGEGRRAAVLQAGMAAFRRSIRRHLGAGVRYIEIDVDFNHPEYIDTVLAVFDEMTA